ncbi:MAG: hypothetical protein RAM36_03880 [Arsenophonus sp.]|nr:hypothetical protein [Arsenophonus sp.]
MVWQKCSGIRRSYLDMKFVLKNEIEIEREFTIQTVGNLWKKENGPFGLIYMMPVKKLRQRIVYLQLIIKISFKE